MCCRTPPAGPRSPARPSSTSSRGWPCSPTPCRTRRPYRVSANFEFQDGHGQWHEVDALVVGQSRIHLLELKSYHGRIGGDEHRWVTDRGGRVDRMRSPMVATRRKAQRFKSKLEQEIARIARDQDEDPHIRDVAAKVGRLPWIQEAVFLQDPGVTSHLPADKAHNIFGGGPGGLSGP
ncbi:NERD domain-containing protein [Dietzia sp. SYD-A1]|uniref:NERD domain-containing protein n=1 Tax=Dietzia sp. SYD-A1 TaxID=2780141 RepID=UPI001E5BEA9B|nr:NERD domain-containing protein [Dietzia sp. SYD-A1]